MKLLKMVKCSELDIRIRVTCLMVLTIMLFQSYHTHAAVVNLNPVCNTTVCQKLGKRLLESMNKNVSPCSNFYDYVCGRWPIQNPRPESHDSWTEHDVTELEELKKVKKLLESPDKSTPDNEDLKELYEICMKLPYLEKSPPDVITRIMTIVGHWALFLPRNKDITVPWSVIDNEYIKITGESAIFDLHIVLGAAKGKKYIMPQLQPLVSPYGTIFRTADWGLLTNEKKHYKNSLYKIIKAVAPVNLTYFSNIDKDLNDVINFREDLRQLIEKLPDQNSEDLTVKEFQELYDKQASRDDTAKINWSQKISDIYKSLTNSKFYGTTDTLLVFVNKTYFMKLVHLLRKTSKRVIANHIHLYFAERHLALSPDVKQEIRQSYSNDIYVNGKIREDPPRWKWCIQQHNMQGTMRNMYVEAIFPPKRKAEIEKLLMETKRLMKQQIYESTWLQNDMVEKSLQKITNMTSIIGYSVPTSSNVNSETILDPLVSDIYYLRKENAVCASVAGLQAPLYDLNVPYVIQYGATVAVFGHEVYHAFDRNAVKYDCYGEKWWSSGMRKIYQDQVRCFEKQYEEKRSQELRNYGLNNGGILPDTSSEDVSDVMGVKLAYKGYKQMLEKSKGTCSVLPGFETTSCDQLFFIAFGHSLCTDASDIGKIQHLLIDLHSSPSIRVNGVALNMKEFGTAFGCAPTDPLMQTKRCDIWQN